MTDWVDSLIAWFADQFSCLWESFVAFLYDYLVGGAKLVLDALVFVVGAIPFPAETVTGLKSAYDSLDPSILWFLSKTQIPAALSILGLALAFRVLRRFVTFGIW